MTTELATRKELTPSRWEMIKQIAPSLKESRLFGVSNDAQAIGIMCKGVELGLSLTASFEFIHVIEGKPSLSPRGALALILNSPSYVGMNIEEESDGKGNPKSCSVTMRRNNGLEYTTKFSMADAERAGLVRKGSGWEKYPNLMMKWRCIGFCADIVFPDIIGGLKRADEFGADITPDGDVIEGSWSRVPDKELEKTGDELEREFEQAREAENTRWLNELVSEYGPDAVMAASNAIGLTNAIPATEGELSAVSEKLKKGDSDNAPSDSS